MSTEFDEVISFCELRFLKQRFSELRPHLKHAPLSFPKGKAMSTTTTALPSVTADVTSPVPGFVDRRAPAAPGVPARERRQFTNSYDELSPEAGELARAIDSYKARHRRRFINYEEMLQVIQSMGYRRD